METARQKAMLVVVVTALVAAAVGTALYLIAVPEAPEPEVQDVRQSKQRGPSTSIELFIPVEDRLEVVYRDLPRAMSRKATAIATVKEFLKGPGDDIISSVPKGAELLNLYEGEDGILYLDFSDELRRNFRGDVLGEFLLLRGLYESVLANIDGVLEVKVLLEGAEVETLGGHLSLKRPLGETVSQTLVEE